MSTEQGKRHMYIREFTVDPFIFNVFPDQLDKFCIIIISSSISPVLANLLQFILNSHKESVFIKSTGNLESSLYEVKNEFCNYSHSIDQLKSKLALLDISKNSQFSMLHSDIISCAHMELTQSPVEYNGAKWVYNHLIKNILIPNTLLQDGSPEELSKKNYSHTIWLASNIDEVPKVLWDNSHMIFVTEPDQVGEFMKKRLGTDHKTGDDYILSISTTLRPDMKIMTLNKKRFLP